ncbi:hypothetical protein BGZ75_001375, partial [Mortierella antarctica]
MIFVSTSLAARFTAADIKPLGDTVSSDHHMATLTLTTHGTQHLTRQNAQKYKKPKGFRFQLKETSQEQWALYATGLDEALRRNMAEDNHGLKTPAEEDEEQEVADYKTLDIDKIWNWYSKLVLATAKKTLPGKVVGRSGVRPGSEIDIRNIIRGLARLKKESKEMEKGNTAGSETSAAWETLQNEWTRVTKVIEMYNTREEVEIGRLGEMPAWSAATEEWRIWRKEVKKMWDDAIVRLHADQVADTRHSIKEAIEKRCDQLKTATGKMLDKILNRSRGKVIIDRVQAVVDGIAVNILEPVAIKQHVMEWFHKWHGPRESTIPEPGSRWDNQYTPKEWIEEEWYQGLMDPPKLSEFESVLMESPKHKAPGASGTINELFQQQGKLGSFVLMSATMSRHNILRGPNYSVLKGTTTKDPIHALHAVLEDARENKRELWVVFQDMRRCFDSVSCGEGGMLSLGLRRIKAPPDFIRLCENIATTKVNRVIT